MNKIRKAKQRTPSSVMGSVGSACKIAASHFINRPTKSKKFPG